MRSIGTFLAEICHQGMNSVEFATGTQFHVIDSLLEEIYVPGHAFRPLTLSDMQVVPVPLVSTPAALPSHLERATICIPCCTTRPATNYQLGSQRFANLCVSPKPNSANCKLEKNTFVAESRRYAFWQVTLNEAVGIAREDQVPRYVSPALLPRRRTAH